MNHTLTLSPHVTKIHLDGFYQGLDILFFFLFQICHQLKWWSEIKILCHIPDRCVICLLVGNRQFIQECSNLNEDQISKFAMNLVAQYRFANKCSIQQHNLHSTETRYVFDLSLWVHDRSFMWIAGEYLERLYHDRRVVLDEDFG